jgi:hypothetical protein
MLPQNIDLSVKSNDEQKDDYRLSKTGELEYAIYLNSEEPLFSIKRAGDRSWSQSSGDAVDTSVIASLGEDLNYIDEQEFEFPLLFEGQGVLCRVAMGESGYGVLINNELIAEINLNDEGTCWEVVSGDAIDENTLEHIGHQIELNHSL